MYAELTPCIIDNSTSTRRENRIEAVGNDDASEFIFIEEEQAADSCLCDFGCCTR